jgi:hypothetical protein
VVLNAPFTIEAVIRETSGDTSATARVTLSENETTIGTIPNVVVAKNGIVSAVFAGVKEASVGKHNYTVTISNSIPAESDTSNNTSLLSIDVVQPIATQYSMSYIYNLISIRDVYTQTDGFYRLELDSTESASLNYTSTFQTNTPPASSFDRISWTIETPNGIFDQTSLTNVTRSSEDANVDLYVIPNVNNRNLGVSLSVDKNTGMIQANVVHYYSFHVYLFQVGQDSILYYVTELGNGNAVLRPDQSISLTLLLSSGGQTWGGVATLMVAPMQVTTTHSYTASTPSGGDYSTLDEVWYTRYHAEGSALGVTNVGAQAHVKEVKQDDTESSLPTRFELQQNYPNPFNPSTRIDFALPKSTYVSMKVYDMLGREVSTVVSREYTAGFHSIRWDASSLASGMYLYRIEAGGFSAQKKLMLLK